MYDNYTRDRRSYELEALRRQIANLQYALGCLAQTVNNISGQVGNVICLKKVVGVDSDAPIAGSSIWTHPQLLGRSIDFMVLNDIMESDYGPGADFTFNPTNGTISISPNQFQQGDNILVQIRLN